ncbi:MAG: P-loop NTPase [Desulfobacterota bacterium]|nr:P-loop NTPase [Thermodesulfobacteriota bacterium]MDW8001525.1 P-loop NTPase [Deltaproteobacteria bacterium]
MLDPRLSVIEKRLSNIGEIIAISGGKGGVGKTTVACLLALFLSKREKRVGLFDMDFYGPSTHVILGIDDVHVEEDRGIIPPQWNGISYMCISLFTKGNPLPMRGKDLSNAILEFLSTTIWKKLDYLILDLPPGTGEVTLEVLRFLKKARFLLTTTPSKVAKEVLKKEIAILKGRGIEIIGVIENQKIDKESQDLCFLDHVPILGTLPFDENFEKALGSVDKILATDLYARAEKLFQDIFFSDGR